ncbi:hypothetical protein P8C59_009335 [Phyllachora maydis]|uniref:Uncharacterized protein n=1 Tax=Phyllachora maydis TaxID=1825666 RepID=A0AAD9ICE6_9PEZI|nr:hypothetical protein P8C59_009335 [Phyllachora maydis]
MLSTTGLESGNRARDPRQRPHCRVWSADDIQHGPQFRRLSDASSIISDIFKHPDVSEDDLKQRIREADERPNPKDLIDFLRNTSPPPTNLMSIPDSAGTSSSATSDKGRWRHFRAFRAKTGQNVVAQTKAPAEMTLPDSAVAGRTIGGHRHIAISIPLQFDHVGPETAVRAESPSLGKVQSKLADARITPSRRNSDHGLLTSLKSVAEVREFGNSSPPQRDSAQASHGQDTRDQPHGNSTLDRKDSARRPLLARRRHSSGLQALHLASDEHRVRASGSRASGSRASGSRASGSRASGSRASVANKGLRLFPQRRSSLGHTHGPGRDGNARAGNGRAGNARAGKPVSPYSADGFAVRHHRRGLASIDSHLDPRPSITDSIATDGTELVLVRASTARAYTSPVLVALEPAQGSDGLSGGAKSKGLVDAKAGGGDGHREAAAGVSQKTVLPECRGTKEGESTASSNTLSSAPRTIPERRRESRRLKLANGNASKLPLRKKNGLGERSKHMTEQAPVDPSQTLSMTSVLTIADTAPTSPYFPPQLRLQISPGSSTGSNSTAVTAVKVKPRPAPLRLREKAGGQGDGGGGSIIIPKRTTSVMRPPARSPLRPAPFSPSRQSTAETVRSSTAVPLDRRISLARRRELRNQKGVLHGHSESRQVRKNSNRRGETSVGTSSHAEPARDYEALRVAAARERDTRERLARLERHSEAWLGLLERLDSEFQLGATKGLGPGSVGMGHGSASWGQGMPSWEELKKQEMLEHYRLKQEQERASLRAQREQVRLSRRRLGDPDRRSAGVSDSGVEVHSCQGQGRGVEPPSQQDHSWHTTSYTDSYTDASDRPSPSYDSPHVGQRAAVGGTAEANGSSLYLGRGPQTYFSREPVETQAHEDSRGHGRRTSRQARPSVLQEELEWEMDLKRQREAVEAKIDAEMNARMAMARAAATARPPMRFSRHRAHEPESDGLESTPWDGSAAAASWSSGPNDGYVYRGGIDEPEEGLEGGATNRYWAAPPTSSGLHSLEPLMRDLMGGSRSHVHGSSFGPYDGGMMARFVDGSLDEEDAMSFADAEYFGD